MSDRSETGRGEEGASVRRGTKDGKRQFLVYLDPEIIKQVKLLAVERETSASQLVGEALTAWLRGGRSGDGPTG